MIFVNWSPDATSIKGRMVYATAKEGFKKYLGLNSKDVTLSSRADVSQILKLDDRKRSDKGALEMIYRFILLIYNINHLIHSM